MKYEDALKALKTATEKANELNIAVTIAVVDAGGHLLALGRLDSVYGVIDLAIKKAKTAVMFGVESDMATVCLIAIMEFLPLLAVPL